MQEATFLKQYISTLQRQLQAKKTEQDTLYKALEDNQRQLKVLDELYQAKNVLSREVNDLREQLQMLISEREQMNEAVNEVIWAREEIIRLNQALQNIQKNKDTQVVSNFHQLLLDNQQLNAELSGVQLQLSQQKSQRLRSKHQIKQLESKTTLQQSQIQSLEDKLDQLSSNYLQIQQAVLDKDVLIAELKQQSLQLKESNSQLLRQMKQKDILINCLESQMEEARQTYRSVPENQVENVLCEIDKVALIRQNNQLTERINVMEAENRGDFYEVPQKNITLQARLQELKDEFNTLSSKFQL